MDDPKNTPAFPGVEYKQPVGGGAHMMTIVGGMTMREYAAIQLKVPDSGTAWLDEMIRTAQRNELAAKVMPAALHELWDGAKRNGDRYEDPVYEAAAKFSHEAANALLKASNA
jgi:hypothetical protein